MYQPRQIHFLPDFVKMQTLRMNWAITWILRQMTGTSSYLETRLNTTLSDLFDITSSFMIRAE